MCICCPGVFELMRSNLGTSFPLLHGEGGVRTAASVHVQAPVVACLCCCDTPLIVGLGGEPPTDSVNSPATRHRWILMSQISFHKQPAVTFHLNESRSVSAGGCSWCQCVVRTVAGGPQPRTSPSATHNTLLPAGDIPPHTPHPAPSIAALIYQLKA